MSTGIYNVHWKELWRAFSKTVTWKPTAEQPCSTFLLHFSFALLRNLNNTFSDEKVSEFSEYCLLYLFQPFYTLYSSNGNPVNAARFL